MGTAGTKPVHPDGRAPPSPARPRPPASGAAPSQLATPSKRPPPLDTNAKPSATKRDTSPAAPNSARAGAAAPVDSTPTRGRGSGGGDKGDKGNTFNETRTRVLVDELRAYRALQGPLEPRPRRPATRALTRRVRLARLRHSV